MKRICFIYGYIELYLWGTLYICLKVKEKIYKSQIGSSKIIWPFSWWKKTPKLLCLWITQSSFKLTFKSQIEQTCCLHSQLLLYKRSFRLSHLCLTFLAHLLYGFTLTSKISPEFIVIVHTKIKLSLKYIYYCNKNSWSFFLIIESYHKNLSYQIIVRKYI